LRFAVNINFFNANEILLHCYSKRYLILLFALVMCCAVGTIARLGVLSLGEQRIENCTRERRKIPVTIERWASLDKLRLLLVQALQYARQTLLRRVVIVNAISIKVAGLDGLQQRIQSAQLATNSILNCET
jgi:hypothetical protein